MTDEELRIHRELQYLRTASYEHRLRRKPRKRNDIRVYAEERWAKYQIVKGA